MKNPDNKGLSIFYKLLLAFIAIVTVISGSMTVVHYVFSKQSIENQTRERLQQVFTSIEDHFIDDIDSYLKDVRLLASNPLLDEFIMSSEIEKEINARALERLFLKSIDIMPDAKSISYTDYSGMEQVKVDKAGRIRTYMDVSGSTIFKNIAEAPPNAIYIDGPNYEKDGSAFLSIGIHKIDADIGEFGGAVVIEYNLGHFIGYLSEIKIFHGDYIWAFTPDGKVIKEPADMKTYFDPRPHISDSNQNTPLLLSFSEGMVLYKDFSYYPDKPLLRLAISIPSIVLFDDINRVLRFLSVVFLLSLAITILIVSYLSRYMSRPIIKLADAATRLAKGDLSASVDITTGGEVGMLVDSFNKMTSDIQNTTVSKNYFNNIIQSIFNPLIVIATDHTILMVNSATCKFLGYSEEELIGTSVANIINAELLDNELEINGNVTKGVIENTETLYTTKDGVHIPVIFSSSVILKSDGSTKGFVCVAQDITELVEAQQRLEVAQSQLVDSAHKAGMADIATGILHNLGNVLNSVNSSSEEITHIVSKSKVTSLLNANQLLKENLDHIGTFLSSDEKGRKLPEFYLKLGAVLQEENSIIEKNMKRIEDKINTMKGIVETQQDYAKAEFHSEKEELPKIINDVLKIQKDLIDANGVHVQGDYDKPLRSKVQKYKLVQVLLNLVKNAVESMKRNDFQNKIKELTIETGHADDSEDYIRVKDNGCGIPPENLVKIFNHGFTTKENGHGFGLHASANAMTEMGGSITVDSNGDNKGTVFTVKLPVQSEEG